MEPDLDGHGGLKPILLEDVEDSAAQASLVPILEGLGDLHAADLDVIKLLAKLHQLAVAHALQLQRLHVEAAPERRVVDFGMIDLTQPLALAQLASGHILDPLLQAKKQPVASYCLWFAIKVSDK